MSRIHGVIWKKAWVTIIVALAISVSAAAQAQSGKPNQPNTIIIPYTPSPIQFTVPVYNPPKIQVPIHPIIFQQAMVEPMQLKLDVVQIYGDLMPTKPGTIVGLGTTLVGGVEQFVKTVNYIGAAAQMISPLPTGTSINVGTNTITTTTFRSAVNVNTGLVYTQTFQQTLPANFVERYAIQRFPSFQFDAARPFTQTTTIRLHSKF